MILASSVKEYQHTTLHGDNGIRELPGLTTWNWIDCGEQSTESSQTQPAQPQCSSTTNQPTERSTDQPTNPHTEQLS